METVSNLKVTDRQSFIKFIELFREDFLNKPEEWENETVDRFLEAMSAYAADIQGYYDNMKIDINADKPTRQTFADILRGAAIYE